MEGTADKAEASIGVDEAFVYGPSKKERIVSCEVTDGALELYVQDEAGVVTCIQKPYQRWMLAANPAGSGWTKLNGNLHYSHIKTFRSRWDLWDERKRQRDTWMAYDDKEQAMLLSGFTYYRGLKLEDVGVLAFDIESTSLEHEPDAKVLIISNTYKRGPALVRRMFKYTDYSTQQEMISAWCAWVCELDPSILCGYNIYEYDLPYIEFCAGMQLPLGRANRPMTTNRFESKFRKDGSMFFTYRGINVPGREVIDVMFLTYQYDRVPRKYSNYKLKTVVAEEGLEVPGRQHYDAALIARNYKDPVEWEKICAYAEFDADDALNLFFRFAPAYFYLARNVPKSFQAIINGSTGSQVNSFLVRSYLTAGHSIPKASDAVEFEGAISIGNPGVYRNVFKVDVASLYPSIMLEYKVQDTEKDPLGMFPRMVAHFTEQRLANKAKAKLTGDRYYKDLSEAEKVFVNSAYGFLGAPGLSFNSPSKAAFVTETGRAILKKAIWWAGNIDQQLVNADTDSIAMCGGQWKYWKYRQAMLASLNSLFPQRIRWEDDGVYDAVLVVKAKNYVMRDEAGVLKTKGSALKASMKEPALREFLNRMTATLLDGADPVALYEEYVREIVNLTDITRWCSKKTVTDKILNPARTNESRILEAIGDEPVQEGDRVLVYFAPGNQVKLASAWASDHDVCRLLEKLYKTAAIFDTVVPKSKFPNYKLKRNQAALAKFSQKSSQPHCAHTQ